MSWDWTWSAEGDTDLDLTCKAGYIDVFISDSEGNRLGGVLLNDRDALDSFRRAVDDMTRAALKRHEKDAP
jgi:hypothetical protein